MTSSTSKALALQTNHLQCKQNYVNVLSRSQTDSLCTSFFPLKAAALPHLTQASPSPRCQISVIIPVRNEAENLPSAIAALAHQIDDTGSPIYPERYEVLVLANNCSDNTVAIARQLKAHYPLLQLQVVEVSLAKAEAHVGKARQMIMDEAYRRFAQIGLEGRIIASTDGDTEVAPNWISTLLKEFDKGIDAVGGRIITRRLASEISPEVSLYYLRRLAHAYFAAQIECLLDPQPHDCWPRHFQYCGANMAVSAVMYGKVGGMPLVRDEEDVALYRQLQQADAKIRHSLDVRVSTSARQVGRATGGLSELLETLSNTSQARQAVLVESPSLTEARILLRQQLRQTWTALQSGYDYSISSYVQTANMLSNGLGLSSRQLCQQIETASTFGRLLVAIASQQKEQICPQAFVPTTEISFANMHLRQRLRAARQKCATADPLLKSHAHRVVLQSLQQVQAIPIFSPAYQ